MHRTASPIHASDIIYTEEHNEYYVKEHTDVYLTETQNNKAAPRLNAGLGIEYRLSKRCILFLCANYTHGLQEIYRLNIITENKDSSQQGDIIYKGTNYNISWGVKVPFGIQKKE